MSNAILDCIGFALLCSVIGPENSRHFISQSQRGYSRFPALQRVGLFLFWVLIGSFRYFPQFWLAPSDISLSSDWPVMILWFWFYDTLSCDLIRSRRFAQQASYPNHETVLWLDIKKITYRSWILDYEIVLSLNQDGVLRDCYSTLPSVI